MYLSTFLLERIVPPSQRFERVSKGCSWAGKPGGGEREQEHILGAGVQEISRKKPGMVSRVLTRSLI